MGKDKKLSFSNVIAVIALLISFGALYFAYWEYHDSQREDLLIIFEPYMPNQTVYVHENSYLNFHPFEIHLDCILVNVGNRPISIISHDVYNLRDEEERILLESDSIDVYMIRPEKEGYFTHAHSFYNHDGTRAYLPFSIQIGQSLRKSLRVTLNIDEKVFDILAEKFNTGTAYNYAEILHVLNNHNVDLFGNEVRYSIDNEGERFEDFGIMYINPPFDYRSTQRLKIEFTTGSGNVFSEEFEMF